VNQEKRDEGHEVPIFIVTHHAKEQNMLQAVEMIENLESVTKDMVFIRIL
jgi:homoserine dehydrogenase